VQTNASTSISLSLRHAVAHSTITAARAALQKLLNNVALALTIINHLLELIEMNQPVDLNQLVLPVRQHLIVKAMEAVSLTQEYLRTFERKLYLR